MKKPSFGPTFVVPLCSAAILIAVVLVCSDQAHGQVMTSPHYSMESDSLNFGGARSASASYSLEDTLGEVATGISSSTDYSMFAGYQQMQLVGIAVVPPSNVILTPAIGGVSGGTANGAAVFQVTTDDPAGYSVTIQASTSPALVSGSYSFADYAPGGSSPDFTFTVSSSASVFAFSPKGSDLAPRYLDNGVNACGTGSNQTAGACWDGLSTSPITIDNRATDNQPGGTVTTLNFRAASGSNNVQASGLYTATTTLTVIAS